MSQRLRQNPRFDPARGGDFTTEDYFVWSRIDGYVSIRDLLLMTGFGVEQGVATLRKLREVGAILVGNEGPEAVADRLERAATPPALELSDAERAAMAEEVDLTEAEKRRIITALHQVDGGDPWELLGVDAGADRRAIKRAYFKVSKDFHPDRYYGKRLGSFGEWLTSIFDAAHQAFELLSDPARRQAYERRRAGQSRPAGGSQTPAEHAADLFQRACGAEVSGDPATAEKLFAAAVRVDPRPRYLRRAASFCLERRKLPEAEEYARKAADLRPKDPSYTRLLGDILCEAGKLDDAERILEHALGLKSENDVLRREIEVDLAEVRRRRQTDRGGAAG